MKFCPECGAKLLSQKFCQECGANIGKYLGGVGNDSQSDEGFGNFDFSAMEHEAKRQLEEKQKREQLEAEFEIENGVLKKYKGNKTSVTIPNGITKLDNYSFADCTNVVSVIIPDTVRVIGQHAFMRCKNLEDITIPNGVTVLEEGIFEDCESLKNIVIPTQINSIKDNVFRNCASLKNLYYNAKSVDFVGRGMAVGWFSSTPSYKMSCAFENVGTKSGGVSVTIGADVVKIPDCLFYCKNCNVTSVSFERNSICESIGAYAFYDSNIEQISLPNRLMKIGEYAFSCCERLNCISIPNSVKQIGERAFGNCERLAAFDFPQGLTKIENETLIACKHLSRLMIPNCVIEIGESAFASCENLSSISIPDSVQIIGRCAFRGCSKTLSLKLPKRLYYVVLQEAYEFESDDWKITTY